jgi:DNA-binding NtrC family response regulator
VATTPNRLLSIVDDELDILYLFRDALHDIPGCTVFTFADSALAFEHFKINKGDYAMVLSDLRMPGMDGMQLIKQIKEIKHSVRTILMTAFAIDDKKLFQEYAAKNIINGFLEKPVRIADLLEEVNNQLKHHQIT